MRMGTRGTAAFVGLALLGTGCGGTAVTVDGAQTPEATATVQREAPTGDEMPTCTGTEIYEPEEGRYNSPEAAFAGFLEGSLADSRTDRSRAQLPRGRELLTEAHQEARRVTDETDGPGAVSALNGAARLRSTEALLAAQEAGSVERRSDGEQLVSFSAVDDELGLHSSVVVVQLDGGWDIARFSYGLPPSECAE